MDIFIAFVYWALLLALVVDNRKASNVLTVTVVYIFLSYSFIVSLDLSLQQAVIVAFMLLWVKFIKFED